jgi:hypothetical protein
VPFEWNKEKVTTIFLGCFVSALCCLLLLIFGLLCRKRKPRKNTTKNWIPKELRTSTSQNSAPNEATTLVPNNITVEAETVVFEGGSHEDVTTDAALVRVETPPSSPPRSVKWLVKKITPRKNFKRAATRE